MEKIQKSALSINIAFFLIIALGALVFLGTYTASHASTTRSYCERQFNISFFRQITPTAQKRCSSEFKRITEWEIKAMNHFAEFTYLPK